MKTNTTLLSAVIISLVIGGLIGYFLNNSRTQDQESNPMDHSMHMGDDTDMETMMMDMTARMEGKSGDELDKIFLEDMIVHHQGAVDMAIIIEKGTKKSELRTFAREIIAVQDQEITLMSNWLEEWFPAE
jgi:uncharacterized protein (DUF305 family)